MSETVAIPSTTCQRRKLAADQGLRREIVEMLIAGMEPVAIAHRLRSRGVTTQRVWNVRTSLERQPEPVPVAEVRDCLHCRKPFPSAHRGNRLCRKCVQAVDHGPFELSFGGHARIRLR